MKVYHGGTDIIQKPLVHLGRNNLDFGPGFYVTTLFHQAKAWAVKLADYRSKEAIVNIYNLDYKKICKRFSYKSFPCYDQEWLNFIVNNRLGKDSWKEFDMVEGGIADDRVIDTVELFMGGYITEQQAINRLKSYQPNQQICVINQEIVDKFMEFEKYMTI